MPSKLDQSQIDHLAHLARLTLTDDEKERFSRQISAILDHVEELKKIDAQSIELINQISGLENVIREDSDTIGGETLPREEALKNAAGQENGYVKIRSIF